MRYALGLGLLLLSFFQNFSAVPWPAAHSEIFAFFAVLVWGWRVVGMRSAHISQTPPIVALLCVALLIGLQYFGGQIFFGGDAITLLLYVQLCLGAVMVGQVNAQDANWPFVLALGLLVAALGSAFIALAQAVWVWNESGWIVAQIRYRRPGANFGQPNHLATLLVMGVASLVYLNQRIKITRITLILLNLSLLLGMAITESRTGLISGVILSLWCFLYRKDFGPMPRWGWMASSIVALIILMWIWPHWITSFHEAGFFTTGGAGLSTVAGTRMLVWQQLLEAVWIRPWLGWGLRGTSIALNGVFSTQSVSESFTYAHNIILDMAVGMGIPLTILALLVLGKWGWTRLRNVCTLEAWYAVSLLIPFVIHSMLEYPFAYAYFLVPVMLAVGLLEHAYSASNLKIISRKILATNFIIFGGLLVWLSVEYMEVEEDFRVARFESMNVGKTVANYERPHITLLTQLSALLDVTRAVPHTNMSLDKLRLLQSTALRFPFAPIQNCYALSLALNGDVLEAQRQLRVIRAMHGAKVYGSIRMQWDSWAREKYPQLQGVAPV